jgi:hypothetical protein
MAAPVFLCLIILVSGTGMNPNSDALMSRTGKAGVISDYLKNTKLRFWDEGGKGRWVVEGDD